jgi:hypothetical protein
LLPFTVHSDSCHFVEIAGGRIERLEHMTVNAMGRYLVH